MAEAKLVLRSGEVFVFKDENNKSNSKTMKDLISSVRSIQTKVNDKLTEIVNDEKEKASGNIKDLKESDFADDGEEFGDSDEDSDEDNDEPAIKRKKDGDGHRG